MKYRIIVLFLLFFAMSSTCYAATIDFTANPNPFITDYAGFNWTGGGGSSSWVNGSVNPLSSAPANTPLGYAWSNGGTDLEFSLSSPGTFTFNSVDLYADHSLWGGSAATFTISGFSSGTLVNTLTTPILDTLERGVFSRFTLNWSNINTITFTSSLNENLLLANLAYNEKAPVPEPATFILLGSGLAGLAFYRRKRK